MCDIGLVLGIGTGIMSAVGQAQTAQMNAEMIERDRLQKEVARTQEMLIEKEASQKEANRAELEKQSAMSTSRAIGGGMMGASPGLRIGEQAGQGARNVFAAQDRGEWAESKYETEVQSDYLTAVNRVGIEAQKASPLNLAATVLGSAMSNYGAFG